MKRRLLLPTLTGISLAILAFVVFGTSAEESTTKTLEPQDISSLREQHAKHLENSPFKKSLKLSKKERKAMGLPPNKYYEQMFELSLNPSTGRIEPEKILDLQEKLELERGGKGRISQRAPGDAADNAWEERGPNDIGGRTRAIMFDPNDANNRRVFAGGVSGGLWRNDNITSASSSWVRVGNLPGNLSVTSITVDPRNSNTWYIGTGEQYTAGDVVGSGVYKSTDGGNSWNALTIPADGAATNSFNANNLFVSGIYFVNDIVAWDNGTSTEILVGVGAHRYGDAESPANWLGLQSAGLYRSTNGGSTWSRINTTNLQFDFQGTPYNMIPNDFEVGPDNKLWMGTISTPGLNQGGGRVFSSTNGSTWTEAAASPLTDSNRVELEVSATDANKIYALTQGAGAAPVHIYRTTNGFATAPTETALPNDVDSGIPANDFTRGQSFYDLMIEADPTNDNIFYVGGIDLFRTTNSGNSWTQISKWSNNGALSTLSASFVHADQHAMTFRPGNSNQAIFGNDGGVYYASSLSTAANNNVFGARNNNYNVTQYVKAGIGPNGAGDTVGIFTAGAQDNGSQAFRNGNASPGINGSEELSDGDGFYTFVDKDGQYMTATFVNNVIYRFSLPWNGLGRRQGGATTLLNSQTTGDFVNQMGYDSDANYLLSNYSSGTSFAIRTINVAANSNQSITNAALTAKPTAFYASPYQNNSWLVGLANGDMVRLTNVSVGNATWSTITTPFVGSVSSVRQGRNANEIMATIHNYGVTSVWHSDDGGANWTSKEGNLPDIPVRDILQNPLDPTEVILGTQLGVWVTTNFDDANPTWSQAYNGMSDASVTSFDYWDVSGDNTTNKIIASTYGRGVFTGSFTANGATPDSQAPSEPTNLTAGAITQTTVDLSWTASTDNVGVTGYDVLQGTTVLATVATTNYQVTGLTANTAYTFSVRANDAAGNTSSAATVNATTQADTPNVCTADVSAFPYNEGFESGIGAWTQATGDDFDWTRRSGGTPSNGTGPTGADEGTFYMYTEMSNPNFPSRTAIFNSPCFDLSTDTEARFAFRYQMNGASVGVFRLEASTDNGGSWTEIFSRSGAQGAAWQSADVNLAAYVGTTVRLRFSGTSTSANNGWSGDIAIDAISLTTGAVPDTEAPSVPTNLTSSNITETGVNLSWTASTDNVAVTEYEVLQGATVISTVTTTNFSVTGLTASTDYTFTVRAKDAAGNTSTASNAVNVTTLTPPDTTAPTAPTNLAATGTTTSSTNLSWTASTDNVGVTGYDVLQDGTVIATSAVTSFQVTGLASATTYSFTVIAKDDAGNESAPSNALNVTTNTGGGGTTTGCSNGISTFPYNEGFESGIGAWSQATGDDFDWTRRSGGTPSNGTGPTGADEGTFYMYTEMSNPNFPSRTAIFNSPCFDLSAATQANFTFRYQMNGASVGTLRLEASNNNGSSWTEIFSRSGAQGAAWQSADVDLAAYVGNSVQLRFSGTSTSANNGWSGDLAIDNISLSTGGGTTGGGDPTPPTGYCASNGQSVADEYISNVTVGGINNTSGAGAGGYSDFTAISTPLSGANTITITPTWTGQTFNEAYAVWIDYNRDGDFEDIDELVFSQTPTQATSISGNFTVPSSASAGPTRMRVTMKYNAAPTSCESFRFGEVEDYIVVLGGSATTTANDLSSFDLDLPQVESLDISFYPNPVKGGTMYVSTSSNAEMTYSIMNLLGQQVAKGKVINKKVDVQGLAQGTYMIEVISKDNQRAVERFIKD